MSEKVIDLAQWKETAAEREEPASTFTVWGEEGERTRLALPVWRAIYLLGGDRGGILELGEGGEVEPFFVLDLASDPARLDFDGATLRRLGEREPPRVEVAPGIGGVCLAQEEARTWLLLVTGEEVGGEALERRSREDLLFLAGECAGLLCHWDLPARD